MRTYCTLSVFGQAQRIANTHTDRTDIEKPKKKKKKNRGRTTSLFGLGERTNKEDGRRLCCLHVQLAPWYLEQRSPSLALRMCCVYLCTGGLVGGGRSNKRYTAIRVRDNHSNIYLQPVILQQDIFSYTHTPYYLKSGQEVHTHTFYYF